MGINIWGRALSALDNIPFLRNYLTQQKLSQQFRGHDKKQHQKIHGRIRTDCYMSRAPFIPQTAAKEDSQMSVLPGQCSKSKPVPPPRYISRHCLEPTNRKQIQESPRIVTGSNCLFNMARKASLVPKASEELYQFHS